MQQASYAVEETVIRTGGRRLRRDSRAKIATAVSRCWTSAWHSTDLVVYDGEAVLLARSLPISRGPLHARRRRRSEVQYDDAERLKVEYGCAILGLTADNS